MHLVSVTLTIESGSVATVRRHPNTSLGFNYDMGDGMDWHPSRSGEHYVRTSLYYELLYDSERNGRRPSWRRAGQTMQCYESEGGTVGRDITI